jgi:hypothetical protein
MKDMKKKKSPFTPVQDESVAITPSNHLILGPWNLICSRADEARKA